MKHLFRLSYIIVLTLGLSASNSNLLAQQVLAGWDFNGVTVYGNSPLTPNTTEDSVTVVGLSRGSGVTTSGTAANNAWGGDGFITSSPSFSSAATADETFSFTITPIAGVKVSLSSISAYNIRRSSTAPTTGRWQYKVGSGSFNDIGTDITWGNTTSAAGNSQSQINLSGIASLQNVAPNTTITFRLVLWGATNATGNIYFNNSTTGNDLIINGTVSPATVTPTITLSSITDNSYCINATTSFDASFTATGMSSPSYVLELSDNAGSFTSATSLATGTTSPLTASIAANTYTAGTGYKVRIRETTTGTVSNTIDVAMLAAPTGSITDVNPIVCYGLPAKVRFTTTSTASPFSLMIGTTSPGTAYTGIINNDEITVESSATSAKTYSLYKITDANGCITD